MELAQDRQNITDLIASIFAGPDNPDHALTPQQLLVVAGILAGLLDVDSILVDKRGEIDVVLKGYIKEKVNKKNLL